MPVWYSESCRIRYVETLKVASSSIMWALLESDGIECKSAHDAHSNRRWYRPVKKSFKPLLVFSFVRHPLDRLTSVWRDKIRTGAASEFTDVAYPLDDLSFAAFVRWLVRQDPATTNLHWTPQAVAMRRVAPNVRPTWIGHYERLGEHWSDLRTVYGLPRLRHTRRTAKGRKNWRDYYTPELAKLAAKYYARDFKILEQVRCSQPLPA